MTNDKNYNSTFDNFCSFYRHFGTKKCHFIGWGKKTDKTTIVIVISWQRVNILRIRMYFHCLKRIFYKKFHHLYHIFFSFFTMFMRIIMWFYKKILIFWRKAQHSYMKSQNSAQKIKMLSLKEKCHNCKRINS